MLKEYTDVKISNYKGNADLTYSEIVRFKHETELQEEMSATEDTNTSFHISKSSSESQTTNFSMTAVRMGKNHLHVKLK